MRRRRRFRSGSYLLLWASNKASVSEERHSLPHIIDLAPPPASCTSRSCHHSSMCWSLEAPMGTDDTAARSPHCVLAMCISSCSIHRVLATCIDEVCKIRQHMAGKLVH
jgi:hypothetical protein